jgi:hypothetical protein
VQLPEQFKTGWLSELSSDMVVEPCQLDIKSDAKLIFQSVELLAHTLRCELDIEEFIEVCNKVPESNKKAWPLPIERRVRSIQMALVLPRLSPPVPLRK